MAAYHGANKGQMVMFCISARSLRAPPHTFHLRSPFPVTSFFFSVLPSPQVQSSLAKPCGIGISSRALRSHGSQVHSPHWGRTPVSSHQAIMCRPGAFAPHSSHAAYGSTSERTAIRHAEWLHHRHRIPRRLGSIFRAVEGGERALALTNHVAGTQRTRLRGILTARSLPRVASGVSC